MRGALQSFIEATTPYKVCDAVDNDASAIHKAMDSHCDLILLHLARPLQDSQLMVSLLRSKLPHVKIVGLSIFSSDVGNQVSPGTGFDALITKQDGLSKLVEVLKVLN